MQRRQFYSPKLIVSIKTHFPCFVHKSGKFPIFEPTFDYAMLRNSGTVRPIFIKVVSKDAQDAKLKSRESLGRETTFARNHRAKRTGGGGFHPPRPF